MPFKCLLGASTIIRRCPPHARFAAHSGLMTEHEVQVVPIAALEIALAHEELRSSIASMGVARTSKPKSAWPTIS